MVVPTTATFRKNATGHAAGGHTNHYREQVCVGNWVEDRQAAKGDKGTLGSSGVRFTAQSVSQTAYTPEGKAGQQLAASYRRHDLDRVYAASGTSSIIGGGSNCFATLNNLTYGPKQEGEPRVQQYLWNGKKKNDRNVPLQVDQQALTTVKAEVWAKQLAPPGYQTTYKEGSAQLLAAGPQMKREKCLPQAEGGQQPQIGRKATGACSALFDAEWVKIGLRSQKR